MFCKIGSWFPQTPTCLSYRWGNWGSQNLRTSQDHGYKQKQDSTLVSGQLVSETPINSFPDPSLALFKQSGLWDLTDLHDSHELTESPLGSGSWASCWSPRQDWNLRTPAWSRNAEWGVGKGGRIFNIVPSNVPFYPFLSLQPALANVSHCQVS